MRLCWLNHSGSGEGLGSQEIRCQSRKAAPGPFLVPEQLASEPSDHPDDIHRGRGQHLLEVRACQTNIATLAQIKATHRLGERTFHAGPQGILRTSTWRASCAGWRPERGSGGAGHHPRWRACCHRFCRRVGCGTTLLANATPGRHPLYRRLWRQD